MNKKEREEYKQQEEKAIGFVEEIYNQFTVPIVENIDKFLTHNKYEGEIKAIIKKLLMITIANSILVKSGASRKELNQSYKGFIADFDKCKMNESQSIEEDKIK